MRFYLRQLTILSGALLVSYFALGHVKILEIGIGLAIIAVAILHITNIIQRTLPHKIDFLERLSLGIAAFFVGCPLLLYLAYITTHTLYELLPIYMCVAVFLISTAIQVYQKDNETKYIEIRYSIFYILFLIFGIFIGVLTLWYAALPDLDPYGWIQTLQPQFQNHTLPQITERPFFAALTYIFVSILRIDIFTFFKYIFPFLSLAILVPLWLVIRKLPKTSYKILFLLYLLGVPSTALYMTTPTPEAILIILSVYAAMLLIYSRLTRNSVYYFSAGIILLSSFFYHQAAAILFLPWCIVTLVAYKKTIFSKRKNILIGTLVLIILHNQVKVILDFIIYWGYSTYVKFFDQNNVNLSYPAQYVNIDQNQMGWPGFSGVIKFYAYYASPLVIYIILISVCTLWYTKKQKIVRFMAEKENAVIILIVAFFLTIAEVLPRFPNIALLPERAWNFVSIFTLPLFFFLILEHHTKQKERIFIILALIFLIAGMGGTLYVNSLKKFLISPEQIASARWIETNLPPDKVIYGYNNSNLIISHAKSEYIDFQENILCSKLSLQDALSYFDPEKHQREQLASIKDMTKRIHEYATTFSIRVTHESESQNPNIAALVNDEAIQKIQELAERIIMMSSPVDPLAKAKGIPLHIPEPIKSATYTKPKFIYFAPKDPRNPYNARGYHPEHWGSDSCKNGYFLFDAYPQKFERIYNRNSIIIWKYL